MKQDPKSVKVSEAAVAVSEVAAPQMVRLYNRSVRQTIEHKPHRAPPSSFVNVPEDVAERWLRLFPETIVEAGVAQREIGGLGAELAAEKARTADLVAKLAAAEARLKTAQV